MLAREGEPFLVRYAVECNAAWETRGVSIELEVPPSGTLDLFVLLFVRKYVTTLAIR